LDILVTAGPTREPLDPVRFISNRSTGRMGYALAQAAARRGHRVCLISGPVALRVPRGVAVVPVVTAAEMQAAIRRRLPACRILIMAAAVSDWRPRRYRAQKLRKEQVGGRLDLVQTPDILRSLRPLKGDRIFIGFAAETEDLIGSGRRKLAAKGLDLIVANDVGRNDSGFEVATNKACFITPDGGVEELPLMLKRRLAGLIVRRAEELAS